ncbi:MoaD/ThiS family protein [Mameliella sp. CS4]|mgnify:CR=1 FL=1|uniref:MoaD/ThiS family protein n=1 Tax=Mameliella sp. CS4 TaxID=2862329 RepID=UPI001C5EB86B|nr:MoaD/ThiS family protein [Mameliella sp. CS4]MBW4983234.1 MoaD/ThiS family protein [Mameliella sp. CS4]
MVAINLWSSLTRFTDGARVVEVEAETVGGALDGLVAAHPGLAPIIEAGVSVVVDGEIAPNRHAQLPEGAEVVLMQRLKGG